MDPDERKAEAKRKDKGCLIAIVGFILLAAFTPEHKVELISGGITLLLFGIAIGHYLATKDQQ